MPRPLTSSWSVPILRVAMGIFLALWGVDKWAAAEGAVGIFSHFYGLDVGTAVVRAVGGLEILLGVALAVGLLPVVTGWIQLVINAITTVASWKQIVDPWGVFGLTEGGTHLFVASIVVMAVSIVLVVEAHRGRAGEISQS